MVNRIIILFLFFITFKVTAQTREVGVTIGQANLLSDIGHNDPISLFEKDFKASYNPAIGIFYKKVLNPKILYKISLSYANIPSNDLNSTRLDRQARAFSTNSELYEGSITLEYNFFNIYEDLYKSTPYIFSGLGMFLHRDYNEYSLTFQRKRDSSNTPITPTNADDYETIEVIKIVEIPRVTIPIGFGYKFRINNRFLLGLEYGFRLTFYDNLDYSSPEVVRIKDVEPDLLTSNPLLTNDISNSISDKFKKYTKGNKNNNDYYSYTGLTFSYLFGKPPCYCK